MKKLLFIIVIFLLTLSACEVAEDVTYRFYDYPFGYYYYYRPYDYYQRPVYNYYYIRPNTYYGPRNITPSPNIPPRPTPVKPDPRTPRQSQSRTIHR